MLSLVEISLENKYLAPVVQKVDNAIHRINHYPADSVVGLLKLIRWIVIYPVDSVIQSSNNRGLVGNVTDREKNPSLLMNLLQLESLFVISNLHAT